jgi:hypothetical protein
LTEKRTETKSPTADDELSAGRILVAFEKLFSGGRGVAKFSRSGLRYVKLEGGAILVEQNPKKKSEWAELANQGHRIAWVMRDGEYLARVVDGEVVMLD